METKFKPERRRTKTARAVRATTHSPEARHSFPVIAQDRPTSQNFSMPETSIQTGDVDFILPLDEIGPKLIELVERGVHAASPSVRSKPSKLAAPSDERGLKRPKGRAPVSQNQSHLVVTPRYLVRTKADMVLRTK